MDEFSFEALAPATFDPPQPHRVVLVRFARAVTGFSDPNAPDIDDHGFAVTKFGPARGPTVGVTQGRTIRVRVVRDRISKEAKLFAVSKDPSVAEVAFPEDGTPLSPDDTKGKHGDCLYLRGASSRGDAAETIVSLRFGSKEGPVLAELGVHVYQLLVVPVQAHRVIVKGIGPKAAGKEFSDQISEIFGRVNRIYAQAGIQFVLEKEIREVEIDEFETPGAITPGEEQMVVKDPVKGKLNAYFVHRFQTTAMRPGAPGAYAFSRDGLLQGAFGPAVVIFDSANARRVSSTTAHEIGHVLTLTHYDDGENSRGTQREDIWAHRCLMFNAVTLTQGAVLADRSKAKYKSTPAREQVGYDDSDPGQLLMTKLREKISQSNQIDTLRGAVRKKLYSA